MLVRPAVPNDERDADGNNIRRRSGNAIDFFDGGIGASERDGSTDVAYNILDDVPDTVSYDGDSDQKQ